MRSRSTASATPTGSGAMNMPPSPLWRAATGTDASSSSPAPHSPRPLSTSRSPEVTAAINKSLIVQPLACATARSSAMGYRSTASWRRRPIGPVSDVAGARRPGSWDRARTVRTDRTIRAGRKRRMASHRRHRLSRTRSMPVGAGLGRQSITSARLSGVESSSEVTNCTPRSPSATTW
jgi:hypothetical protein